ncbi:MAG: hypothetical protein F9K39_13900 [Exiguobacterium chiriqhucha]|uniref:hypothetical protein n=1 Tax=Exiguobacterium chiriqhucha TaxID=1385984 RepID=UPI00144E7DFD|nr:hypothetical protein [Exiguobacterium chiriqhucha]KAB2861173.1 MAG: hypothetical protein F9K39_13900 [Exiguobacterium chiriqhucha]
MQLAIIGTKEEISEILKFVENMRVTSRGERVVRTELTSRIEERTQLQFESMNQSIERVSSR